MGGTLSTRDQRKNQSHFQGVTFSAITNTITMYFAAEKVVGAGKVNQVHWSVMEKVSK